MVTDRCNESVVGHVNCELRTGIFMQESSRTWQKEGNLSCKRHNTNRKESIRRLVKGT